MEVFKLDIVGTYSYKPDIEIATYKKDDSFTKECIICKISLFEPNYETICDNKNILNDNDVVIGKCGHMFHGDCLGKWLKTCDTCPIDKVKWCLHRVADTTTNLVVYQTGDKYNKNKFLKNNFGEKKQYNNKR
jgi:hypothetical protein